MASSIFYNTPSGTSRMHNFGQDEIDYGFQPTWATVPVQAAFDTSPGTGARRDQLLGITRKPIWQEAEEKEKERELFNQEQLDMTATESFALATMATAFHATSGVARIVGTTFVFAGKVLWAVGDGVKNIISKRISQAGLTPMERKIRMKSRKKPVVKKRVKSRMFDTDSETAEDDNEDDSDSDTETTGMQSMLAMPPHMVGATPRIVRNQRRTIRHPAQAPKFSSPAAVKTRRRKMPNTPALKRKVRFEDDSSTPADTRANNAPNTPAFVFNTPKEKKKQMTKKDEFKMNFKKDIFQPWVDYLHKYGWSRGAFRAALANYELPTDIISQLYDMRDTNPKAWDTLIEAHTHDGFIERLKLCVPAVVYPEPIDWEAMSARGGPKVSSESRLQQKDGKCVLCRGMSWAGKVYTREIAEGEDVPCLSHHKSVIPYTQAELKEITPTSSDPVFRRWCQESRWDWLFSDPPASGLNDDETPWKIPNDDPRLRHVARLGDPENLEHPTEAMRMLIFTRLQEKYTAQDLAAKRFIDGIQTAGNLILAEKLKKMDLERKRQQVDQKWLCVRQVKVVVKEKESILRHGRKRTAADADVEENNAKKARSDAAAPVFRKIASVRKSSIRPPANTNTNAIKSPFLFEKPLFTIPAPFDPVEIKKIRLIPPVQEKLTDPDTLFKRRYEESTRFSPKPQKTVSFSASTAAPDEEEEPLSKEELEAIAYNEECERQERLKQLRLQEEEFCRKEREEDAERRKNNPSTNSKENGKSSSHYGAPGPGSTIDKDNDSDNLGSGGQNNFRRHRIQLQREARRARWYKEIKMMEEARSDRSVGFVQRMKWAREIRGRRNIKERWEKKQKAMVEREQKNWGEGMADREMDAWEAEHRRQQALSNSPEDQYNQHITNHSNSPNMSPTCTSGTNTRTNADANGAANADNGFVGSTNNFSVPPSIPKSFQQAQAPSQQSARPQVPFRAKPNPPSHKPARPSVRSISPPLKEAPIKEGQEEQTYKAWKSIPLFRQSGSSSSSGSSASSPAVREPTLPPLPRHAKAKWQGGARIGE